MFDYNTIFLEVPKSYSVRAFLFRKMSSCILKRSLFFGYSCWVSRNYSSWVSLLSISGASQHLMIIFKQISSNNFHVQALLWVLKVCTERYRYTHIFGLIVREIALYHRMEIKHTIYFDISLIHIHFAWFCVL